MQKKLYKKKHFFHEKKEVYLNESFFSKNLENDLMRTTECIWESMYMRNSVSV